MGLRRAPNSLSERTPAAMMLNGPANSNSDPSVPDSSMPVPSFAVTYVGAQFIFQADDGIRDIGVTGVQTCALPISKSNLVKWAKQLFGDREFDTDEFAL